MSYNRTFDWVIILALSKEPKREYIERSLRNPCDEIVLAKTKIVVKFGFPLSNG